MPSSSMLSLVVICCVLLCAHALDNGLGKTPQMGFNTWNHFGCDINEQVLKDATDVIVKLGLKDLGYNYMNLDDCWQAMDRNSTTGEIIADPTKFPNGMASLVDYVHSQGLLFGLYSDAGTNTCGGRPGSLGYEKIDALTYASWGVDYLKYDNCNNENIAPELRYPPMRDALNATGRPIFFSMCEWGFDFPAKWARDVGNSWRTTIDIQDTFLSMVTRILQNDLSAPYAAAGGWNDPDMLQVGNGGLTDSEALAHFSLWAIAKAPLLIGCDLTQMSNFTANIFLNKEVIDVDQDSLGIQGRLLDQQYPPKWAPIYNVSSFITAVPCNGQPEQRWVMPSNGSFIEQGTHRCLTSADCASWADLILATPCGGSCNPGSQTWKFVPVNGSQALVVSYGGALQLFEGLGPQTEQYQYDGNYLQQWKYNSSDQTLRFAGNNNLCLSPDMQGPLEVWAGPQSDGSVAAVLFNRWEYAANITANWSKIGIKTGVQVRVRDLWAHTYNGTYTNSYTAWVEPHSAVMVKFFPTHDDVLLW